MRGGAPGLPLAAAAALLLAGPTPAARGRSVAAGQEVLLGSDILGPLCFDEDLVGPEEARAMREACCGDWGRPGCWDSFYSPQRCCRGTDDAFRAAARGIRERLVRCLQGEGGQVPEGFFEQATHYAFRPSQKLGRAAWCMARQGEVSSALDLYAGEGGGVELLASGLRGTPGGQVLTFEYAPRETAFFQLLEARLAPYGLRVVAPAELERPGELACGGSAMPVVVVNGAAMPAPEITLGSVHNLGPPLLAKSGQSPPSGQPSALEALCRLMLPEFVLLDPSAPNVPEWHVVERSCRPLAVLIGHTSLPCHAGWVRDKLLMRGDWAEIMSGLEVDNAAGGHAAEVLRSRRWSLLVRDTAPGEAEARAQERRAACAAARQG